MKKLNKLYKHLDTCDKYTRDSTIEVLSDIGKQMIHERERADICEQKSIYWHNKCEAKFLQLKEFRNKNIFKRILIAIKKDLY